MEKQVVLITGASKGIGKAIAEYLTSKNNFVIIGTSRNPEKYKTNTSSAEGQNFPYELIKLDVTDDNSVEDAVNYVLNTYGKIDVLINNAGFAVVGPLATMTVEELKQQFEVNLFGAHRVTVKVLEDMRKRKNGKIINIGSFGGRLSLPYQVPYSASKAALMLYTDGLRMELKKEGIKVSLVEPGDIKTNFDEGRLKTKGFYEDPFAQKAVEIMARDERNGVPPIKVAKTVYKIIKSGNPKPRYIVGVKVKMVDKLLRILPMRIIHYLIMKSYGL